MARVSLKAQQSAQTREALVRACMRLFAERGFTNTSLDDIAREARLTKGAIYWHFENKDALFAAILGRIREVWQRDVLQPLSAEADPRKKLERLFDHYAHLFTEDPHVCLFLQRVMLDADQQFAPQVDKVFEQTAGVIAGVLDEGVRSGAFRADLESAALARLIVSSLAGANLRSKHSHSVTLEALLGELRESILLRATIRRSIE
jgi:AcrR family transcriptional regulator